MTTAATGGTAKLPSCRLKKVLAAPIRDCHKRASAHLPSGGRAAVLKTMSLTCGQKAIKYLLPASKGRLIPTSAQAAAAWPRGSPGDPQNSGQTQRINADDSSTRKCGYPCNSAAPIGTEMPSTRPREEKLPGVRGAPYQPHSAGSCPGHPPTTHPG